MADMIERPRWAKGAVPTARGWFKGREKMQGRKFSPEQIAEWFNAHPEVDNPNAPVMLSETMPVQPAPLEEPEMLVETMPVDHPDSVWQSISEPEPEMLVETPKLGGTVVAQLDSMSKRELEMMGREHGIELDRRQSKRSLIGQIKGLLT